MVRLLLLTLAVAILALLPAAAGGNASPAFTHGVASGDVRPHSAILWTRVDQQALIVAEVSAEPYFNGATIVRPALASAGDDFVAKAVVFPLTPDQTYFYRWRGAAGATSEVGRFKTPPLPSTPADLRFAYSGDSDGTLVNGLPFYNNFEALDAARAEGLDFWVYLGDTIYSDSGLRPGGPAQTLDEYRGAYKVNRDYQALRDIMAAASTYAIWDDHEVMNDFDGQTVDPARFAAGREAFLEYMPLLDLRISDPDCAADPLFRSFRWGRDADIIIPDERSCRSGDAEAQCLLPIGLPDLVPTLPIPLRLALRNLLPPALRDLLLPESPPPGCLDAVNDPSRTMLGDVQKQLLKQALLHSSARFKFIINELPIQQFYALPYDRWEGYAAERSEVLDFIRHNHIDNVVFLTTDFHANLVNQVFVDRFSDPAPVAEELVTGPIATGTAEAEIRSFFGGGPLGDLAVLAVQQLLEIVGMDCRNLDAYSYGLVEVDSSSGTATVTLKDDTGAVLHDQLHPNIACVKTIGP